MKKRHLQIFALGLALTAVGTVSGVAARSAPDTPADTTLEDIAGYKHWTRVTEQLIIVPVERLASIGA